MVRAARDGSPGADAAIAGGLRIATADRGDRAVVASDVKRRARPVAVVAALALGVAACGGAEQSAVTLPAPSAPSSAKASAPAPPPSRLTLLDGRSTTLAAFRGRPLLVWFVANGCASCAASIPAVAQHFEAFARARTRILVLGMYGAFDGGAAGRSELASFGRAAAGPAFSNPVWTWALASAGLTAAFDPSGVPDEYFLLDPRGRLVYRNSVPVSTIGALLGHLSRARGRL
jgi:hypothetical protein